MTQSDRSGSTDQARNKKIYKEPKLAYLGAFNNLTMGQSGTKTESGRATKN